VRAAAFHSVAYSGLYIERAKKLNGSFTVFVLCSTVRIKASRYKSTMEGTEMNAEALVLAVLDAVPGHEVRGKKRLQKLSYFAVESGANTDVDFFLHDFGPFSPDVARATDLLSLFGEIIEEDAQYGQAKKYLKVFRLANPGAVAERLPQQTLKSIAVLNDYSTIELEIASTIRFFMREGLSAAAAVSATKELKPSKSEPNIIRRAEDALAKAGLDERRRADQVSDSRSNRI
jgi:uncharacterized protein YwgA